MKNFCAVVILTLISVLPAYAGKWSTGTTAPATCTVGDSWTDTNGTADNRFNTCTATNTWTLNSNQTAIDAKANSSAFASAAAFESAFGWAPGSGSISLSTEQDWTAVQNFDGGLTASGVAIMLGSLSDIKFGTDNWVDDTKTSGHLNYLWSSKMVFDQLALKSDTTHNHTGTYEPADANIIKVGEIDSLAEFTALLGWSPGSGGSFSFDTFPTYEDSAHTSGIAVNGTTLAVYSATASKWLTVGLTDSLDPTPVTYSLTITPASFTGDDKFTYDSTDYTAEQVITGLSADASFTVTPDTGRAITCAGTGLTDNTGGSYTANTDTANVVATCTSSAEEPPAVWLDNSSGVGRVIMNSATYTVGQSFTVSDTQTLHAITLNIHPDSTFNPSSQVKIRVGATSDLSTSYLVESSLVTISATGEVDIIVIDTTLTAGTYYFAVSGLGITEYNTLALTWNPDGAYSGGRAYATLNTFNLTGGEVAGVDLWFKLK